MARWGNASDFRATGIDWQGIVDSGIKGYELGEKVRDKRNIQALGSAMAEGPQDKGIDTFEDTAQSNMLAARQKYNTPEGQRDPLKAIPNVSDSDVQGARKKTTTTTKDWESWEADIRKRAGAISPERLQAANDHITKTQQAGFTKSATKAAQMVSMGNLRGAEAALEEAYSNMPDGNNIDVIVRDGQLFVQIVDEETGKSEGEPQALKADDITGFIQQMQDPVAWGKAVKEGRAATAKAAQDLENFKQTEGRLTNKDINSMTIAERGQKLEERRIELSELKEKGATQARDAQIKKIEADMEELTKASARAEVQSGLAVDASTRANEKAIEEQYRYDTGSAQRDADTQKTYAEIQKLLADANYTSSGKGAGKGYTLETMPHKDLVMAIGKTETQLGETTYGMEADEIQAVHDKARDPNAKLTEEERRIVEMGGMIDRLYAEEEARSRSGGAGITPPPAQAPAAQAPPPNAIAFLRKDPSEANKKFFIERFGKLPEGF